MKIGVKQTKNAKTAFDFESLFSKLGEYVELLAV